MPEGGRDNRSLPGAGRPPYSRLRPSRQGHLPFQSPVVGASFWPTIAVIASLTQLTQLRLIKLRWLSVLAMLAAALTSPTILGSSELMPRLLAFATFIACLHLCMQLAMALNRGGDREISFFSPLIQLTFDLAGWGGYIYLSGGATNPLISVFLPLVAIGAIVLGRGQAWFLGVAAMLGYTVLWRFYQPLDIADAETATRLHLLGMWLVFVVSAIVVVWFIRQMTQAIHERDAALADAREQAIRNDWLIAMGSLAAGAAHELGTPLGTLNVLADDLLEETRATPALYRDVALMKQQIALCKRTLTQLSQRAGDASSGSEPMPAADWLRGTLAAWQSLNPQTNLAISDKLCGQRLQADISIERAIVNLLDNAVKAGAACIEAKVEAQGRYLEIAIGDDGRGMSAAALDSFARRQPVVSSDGMGIGLLLARAAVERIGGELRLNSSPGGGTTAFLRLPITPPGACRAWILKNDVSC